MLYLYVGLLLVVLWILNILISIPIRRKLGVNNELFRKIVSNGNDVFYCMLGLGFIALADFLLDFIKWPIIVLAGILFLINFVQLLVAFISQIVSNVLKKKPEVEWWCVWFSNFISCVAYSAIILGCMKLNFGWI